MATASLFTWDERKRALNLRKHGVDFAIAELFDFDCRGDYASMTDASSLRSGICIAEANS